MSHQFSFNLNSTEGGDECQEGGQSVAVGMKKKDNESQIFAGDVFFF